MDNTKSFRDTGANGAILDEYEKSIQELKLLISTISPKDLMEIVDSKTKDKDCRSIQTILTHVIRAGYTYVIEIRKWLGENANYVKIGLLDSIEEYETALDKMFAFNEKLFQDYPKLKLEDHDSVNRIVVGWGQSFDAEQLFEHAIVHILRHRRQIERFLLKLAES